MARKSSSKNTLASKKPENPLFWSFPSQSDKTQRSFSQQNHTLPILPPGGHDLVRVLASSGVNNKGEPFNKVRFSFGLLAFLTIGLFSAVLEDLSPLLRLYLQSPRVEGRDRQFRLARPLLKGWLQNLGQENPT
jgi:hypothetical protein